MAWIRRRAAVTAGVLALVAVGCGSTSPAVETAGASAPRTTAEADAMPVPTVASTVPPATVLPVTAPPDAVETRELILRLADLPVEGGGAFDPDTVAGTNVLIWFWGPH